MDVAASAPLPSSNFPFRRLSLLERLAFWLSWLLLCIPLFPVVIANPVLRLRKARAAARDPERKGASITALIVLHSRARMDALGMRPDRGAVALHAVGPMSSPMLQMLDKLTRAHMRAAIYVSCLAGGRSEPDTRVNYTKVHETVFARLKFFDAVLEYMRPVGQLVVMGAGYDTRAINNACGGATIVFEVDRPETQAHKLAAIKRAGVANSVTTKYVECNFNEEVGCFFLAGRGYVYLTCNSVKKTQSPWDKLERAGFDRTKPFAVTWEGVSYYLPENVVVDFLVKAGEVMKGNRHACLMLDYFFDFKREKLTTGMAGKAVKAIGEEWLSFYPQDFESYLRSKNVPLRVHDQINISRAGIVMLVPAA